jgi:hypothetical protein
MTADKDSVRAMAIILLMLMYVACFMFLCLATPQ